MILKTNEEMGEAGLADGQASQIEPSSILAPGYADAREQCGGSDGITCMCTFILQHWRACDTGGVVSVLENKPDEPNHMFFPDDTDGLNHFAADKVNIFPGQLSIN